MGDDVQQDREGAARTLEACERSLLAVARTLRPPESHLIDALVVLTAATADVLRALDPGSSGSRR